MINKIKLQQVPKPAANIFSSMPLDLRCLSWVSDLSPFLHSDHSAGTNTLCGGGRTGGLGSDRLPHERHLRSSGIDEKNIPASPMSSM